MPGRVVPWEISWRAVLGLRSSFFVSSGASWVVGLVFAFGVVVAVVASVAVGSRIAEGAIVAVGLFEIGVWCFRAWQETLFCRDLLC